MPKEDYEGRTIIWPSYIDSQVPRSRGRRVPLDQAVPSPSVEEIVRAARELGLNPVVEEKAHPPLWHQAKARVIVDKRLGRSGTIRAIASKVKELRRS
ncbi:MAG: signal recognition particle subunit SRP19/SEC65 family protein [Acidilobus sp.]